MICAILMLPSSPTPISSSTAAATLRHSSIGVGGNAIAFINCVQLEDSEDLH